ncbi:MAG: taurine dioxygenase [Acidimicrobiia bacterium]|nr:taurine dioxygenase [Acidimicrobiia bacterium]
MQVTRVAGALGARIDGVDPRDPAAFDDIKAAVLEHEVVFFRGANLSEEEQFELGRRFGTPSIFPVQRLLGATEPRMTVIQDGPDSPNAADGWHTDATWLAEPPAYALLHMETPPEVGGDTMWCSATAAYDQLAAPMQELLCSLRVIHDNESFIQGVYAKAGDAAPKIADGLREHYPPVEHPMVRTHPETGRRSIVFAWRFMNRIVGFSEHESKSLLTFIGEWVKEPRFHVRWQWEQGDLAIWDERSTLHRASADHWPQKRVIRRLEIDGPRGSGSGGALRGGGATVPSSTSRRSLPCLPAPRRSAHRADGSTCRIHEALRGGRRRPQPVRCWAGCRPSDHRRPGTRRRTRDAGAVGLQRVGCRARPRSTPGSTNR